jgi:very-short-patch-repair endonuclease
VKLAVEFDGPNHFTRQKQAASPFEKPETPRALGHTVLKYRLLKKQGWIVVRVPYYEFDRIPFWASMVRDIVGSER